MPNIKNNMKMNYNELQQVVIQVASADPNTGSEKKGQVYYNSTANELRHYDGTSWGAVNGAQALGDLTDVDLTGLADGFYIYYDNGSGTYKVRSFDAQARLAISVAAGSASYLSYDNLTGELSVKNLLITNVTVDAVETSLAAFIALYYTVGTEFQEGDIIVLTAATGGTETWIHNGGSAGTAADFTQLQNPFAGVVPIAQGGTGQTTQLAAFDALSPLTTKGDLLVFDGTNNVRLPVGTNGQRLEADSTQALGVKWVTPVTPTVKYAQDVTLGTVAGVTTVTHNLGTTDILVQVWDASGELTEIDINNRLANSVDLAAEGANEIYRVVIVG